MTKTVNKFNPVIIVMAKIPQIGMVKTRLRPFLSDEKCIELATCFLKDAISNAARLSEQIIVAYSPNRLKNEAEALIPANVFLVEQHGNNLGERMFSAFQYAENLNFSPIIAIGTDSPNLPLSILQSAIKSFENPENDLVLGESNDGGYYLIGLRKANREIFEGISWSSEKVFTETIEKAKLLGLQSLTQLPVWYDVDFPDDLIHLRNEMLVTKTLQNSPSETAKWLVANNELFV